MFTWKQRRPFWLIAVFVLASVWLAAAAALIDDRFADGNSQNQDLANHSLRVFNGRATTVRTDAAGSAAFDVTNAGGSEAVWAYFTNAGAPVTLGVGDKLAVAMTFSVSGFGGTGQDVRFGVLDSLGTRNTANLTAGMNDATFINDTGYGLQYYASGAGSPFVIGRRAVLTGANPFNNFGDFATISTGAMGATARQALQNDVPYTLSYTITRLTANETQLDAAVTGGALDNLHYQVVESSIAPQTTFDYFAFRIAGPAFATKLAFTRLLVDYTPQPPVITSQPQPAALTVQVGSNVTLAIAARGNAPTFQWQRNGADVMGNASARTATLNLANVQLGDTGDYTCVVSNAGGSVRSTAAKLTVTTEPVPPPPVITQPPRDTTVVAGQAASLSVTATGANLTFQWFRNGALLPGETAAALRFASAQISDAASYAVVASNTSGSVTSAAARLLVVSAMALVNAVPNGVMNVCIDAPLMLTFDQALRLGNRGRLQVYRLDANDNGVLVDTLDLSLAGQVKAIGSAATTFNYYPILLNGNTATIYLHRALDYHQRYFVTLEPGVVTDASGAPFVGISEANALRFTTKTIGPPSGATSLLVSADGTGDFCTVQGAIDFVPVNNLQRVNILVGRGTYNEIVYVPSNKPFITVRGADRELSRIQYANNANLNAGNNRAMFGVDAADFTLENLTLHNTTIKGGAQAEAFRGGSQTGQRLTLNRVSLYSFQDTLMLQGRAYVADSYIEGDVDFMWGGGAVFFQNCDLVANNPGFYTQIRNGQNGNGNVYVNCRLSGTGAAANVYLSRIDPNVFPYSQVAFINCAMGAHILPAGWQLNNATAAPNVQFWEYGSTRLDGAPLDVSQRAPFSRQLTADEAARWSDPAFVLGWTPVTLTAAPSLNLGEAQTVRLLAPAANRASDWVGLFRVGDDDAQPLARLSAGAAVENVLTFKPPESAGRYEFRYLRGDGMRLATSNTVTQLAAPLRRADVPLGFASVEAWGQNGTTGGAGGATVTVTTANEFLQAIARTEPLIIRVNGMLVLPPRMHSVASNKTIVGVGANAGFTGGGLHIGLPFREGVTEPPADAVKNVILRNLKFANSADDALNIQMFTHHVWIDHCDLSNAFDGLVDIRFGASYVTVSWNRFSAHSKTSLVGADDSNAALDVGRLRVTYHHNWFDGSVERHPRVRYGEPVHVFNNFYLNNAGYGVGCFQNSGCVVEGNYFENVATPITINGPTDRGRAVERLNVYARSGVPVTGGAVLEPAAFYGYALAAAEDVRAVVARGAGVGKLRF